MAYSYEPHVLQNCTHVHIHDYLHVCIYTCMLRDLLTLLSPQALREKFGITEEMALPYTPVSCVSVYLYNLSLCVCVPSCKTTGFHPVMTTYDRIVAVPTQHCN